LQWWIPTLTHEVDYVIPANDDASKSIDKILSLVTAAIIEGLSDRSLTKKLKLQKLAAAETVAAEAAPLLKNKN
jgi:small subunit ribosomal protein S2